MTLQSVDDVWCKVNHGPWQPGRSVLFPAARRAHSYFTVFLLFNVLSPAPAKEQCHSHNTTHRHSSSLTEQYQPPITHLSSLYHPPGHARPGGAPFPLFDTAVFFLPPWQQFWSGRGAGRAVHMLQGRAPHLPPACIVSFSLPGPEDFMGVAKGPPLCLSREKAECMLPDER